MGPRYVAQRALVKTLLHFVRRQEKKFAFPTVHGGKFWRWDPVCPAWETGKCRAQYLLERGLEMEEENGNWHKELTDPISIKTPNLKRRLYWC